MNRKGAAGKSAYGIGGFVPPAPASPSGKFLSAFGEWDTPAGGGSGYTNHTDLNFRGWAVSGHTGTASALAAFSGAGAAAFALIGVDVQIYDAGLTSLTAADAAAGLPYTTGPNVWAYAALGDLAVSGSAWQVVQARGIRETAGPTTLVVGAIANGDLITRVGSTIVGVLPTLAAVSVVSEQAFGQASAVGTGTDYARNDHTHGSPALGATGATAAAGNDVRLSDPRAPTGAASGQLGGTYPSPDVIGLRESAGPTLLTLGAVADGQVLQRVGVTVVGATVTPTLGAVFGGGENGVFDLDGVNTFSGFYSKVGSVYTQVRDVRATTYRVRPGVTVLPSQYWIYAEISFLNEGEIRNNGLAAAGITAGQTIGAVGTLFQIGNGAANGRPTTGNGGGGGLGGNLIGGYGGVGGAAGAQTGGVPTTGLPSPGLQSGGTGAWRVLNRLFTGVTWIGAGGGGGGGSGAAYVVSPATGSSGGGGGGASGIRINARSYQNNGTITCTGGAGGVATATGGAITGGGAGGGGGYLGIMADVIVTGTGTATAAGGVGGAGAGGGGAGANGLVGVVDTITPSSVVRS